jgi:hypothetical protein
MSERNSCQSSAATGEMKLAQNGRFEMGSSSIRFLTPIH